MQKVCEVFFFDLAFPQRARKVTLQSTSHDTLYPNYRNIDLKQSRALCSRISNL